MGSPLKVAPGQLRSAAADETAVGAAIGGLGIGDLLSAAVPAVSGLQSGRACVHAAPVVDAAVKAVADEVVAHADRLSQAAAAYERTDGESAHRLIRTMD
ncbi:hypothetical protein KL864_01445 [Mycolicibacterium goodii]|uniref:type VII secretion target n=1 Tax=Mycolicibacterium goodii TaxID=134601 RepID=UPI001BDCF17F|nr:type VII secretion target [Mycolicibacterium goodii]MBU8814575.1 hypothetical protein [Mycolicibacterium goodii]